MPMTEFRSSLGYYTLNALSSLQQIDLTGKLVIDCGSGSGILSLAALSLGAKKVIGFDIDRKAVMRSGKNIIINGFSIPKDAEYHNIDLRDQVNIVNHIKQFDQKEVVLISNIGHWRDYTINSLTSFMLIPLLESYGIHVRNVVSGGYGHKWLRSEHAYPALKDQLSRLNINWEDIPKDDIDADISVLRSLGFDIRYRSISQAYNDNIFPKEAGSIVAFRKN